MKTNSILKNNNSTSSKTVTDRRFVASEQKLKEILLEMMRTEPGISFSVTEFCNRGDFNRRTFYRHYSSVAQLISCQIVAHQNAIKTFAAELLGNSLSHEVNLYKMLFFINKHKDDYAASLARANFSFLRTLAESMKPLVFKEWGVAQSTVQPIAQSVQPTAQPAAQSVQLATQSMRHTDDFIKTQLDKKYTNFSFEVIAELVWWIQSKNTERAEIPALANRIMAILRKYSNA